MNASLNLMDPTDVAPADDAGGIGCLRTDRGNLPLDEITVDAAICGLATHIELTQGFHNPHAEALEAIYIFPLPPRAAVTAMRMCADDRVVEGVLKERGQARANYEHAVSQGRRAAIAEEERPGVLTMRVGNIMPGERVTVHLTLAGQLSYEDDLATFRFPLVVAPRYIPGTPLPGAQVGTGVELDTDAVPDASRISPPVLLPGFPNPVRLSIDVDIDPAGLPLTAVETSLHSTTIERRGSGLRVRLDPGERADRDFLLRMRLGSDAISTSLAVRPDGEEGGTFALTLLPPSRQAHDSPRDVVLVLDRSGSMEGWKMIAARRSAARIIDTLTAADRFAVLAFDSVVARPPGLPDDLVDATDRHRFRAVEFLAGLSARGGTEMLPPLRQAAQLLGGAGDRDRVLVLVTDGQVGDEDRILGTLAPQLGGVRVHTVGIDRLVNEGFLQRLAGLTGGRCELVESEDRLDEAMRHIHRRITAPVLTGLSLRSAGLAAELASLAPSPLPELFEGAPVVISGRFTGPAAGSLVVAGDNGWQMTVPAVPSDNPSLGAVWARARIRDLEDQYVTGASWEHGALEREIVEVSLRFGVLSRFTAFVSVDEQVVNDGGAVHSVTQPVEPPSGWAPAASIPPPPAPAPAAVGMPSGDGAAFGLPEVEGDGCVVLPELELPSPPEFAAQELRVLRDAEGASMLERARLLTQLAATIRRWLGTGACTSAVLRRALDRLAGQLDQPAPDEAELERRWTRAIAVLTMLAARAEPRRGAFWKR